MNNRLTEKLSAAQKTESKLFCAYVTLGYPTLAQTEAIVPALEQAGVDILELGFPFSDPLADGPTIQRASEQALRKGVRLEDSFRIARKWRREGVQIPILFFSYFNPILRYGVKTMARRLKASGFDGIIVPDLPPEEGVELSSACRDRELSLVYLVAPTTSRYRMRQIAACSDGFIYYVSIRGVTGARRAVPQDLIGTIGSLKRVTSKPVLVGFGVSSAKQIRAIVRVADGIVVGSAIVDRLSRGTKSVNSAVSCVRRLVAEMRRAS